MRSKAYKKPTFSVERLREIITYDPETGIFQWKGDRPGVVPGKRAGTITATGHVAIMVFGEIYKSSRLAWFYMTSKWPSAEIDHKNRNRADDRFSNLREASRSQNQANKLARSKSGLKGVYMRAGKFEAQIRVLGKCRWLGAFVTAQEAHSVYMVAAREAFGEFARG